MPSRFRVETPEAPVVYRTPSFRDMQSQCAFLMGQVQELEGQNDHLGEELSSGKQELGRMEVEMGALRSERHSLQADAQRLANQTAKDAVAKASEEFSRTLEMMRQQVRLLQDQTEAATAREALMIAELGAARKGQRETLEQFSNARDELREMVALLGRSETEKADLSSLLNAQRNRCNDMLGEIAACARLREEFEALRESSGRLREECDEVSRKLLASNETRDAALEQLDDSKRDCNTVLHRAHATAHRSIEEKEARAKVEIENFSLQEKYALLLSRHDWLRDQLSVGDSSRREAEGLARMHASDAAYAAWNRTIDRRSRLSFLSLSYFHFISFPRSIPGGRQVKMRLSLFQRISGNEAQRHGEPGVVSKAARREAIMRQRAQTSLESSGALWRP